MIDIQECPVCTNRNLQKLIRCEDYTVSHETFEVCICETCTLAITTPRPDISRFANYYKSEEYISHSGKSSGGMGFLYKTARTFSLNWKKSLIRNYHKQGSIFDFGCGTGEFLNSMKHAGWNIHGLEVSDSARQKAEELNAQKILTTLDGVAEKSFDVITAWHVLEHVPDLGKTIMKLKALLKKDGTIFIAVPNYQSPDAEQYREYWAGFDVPRHLWHFSKKSMNMMLQSAGLKLMDTIPMKLDAYYVSMLSEKYKNKNVLTLSQLLRGFLSGFSSNLKASKTINHSSLIYIARINES